MTMSNDIAGRIANATPNSPTPLFPCPLPPVSSLSVVGCLVKTKSNLTVTYASGLGIGGME